MKTNKEVIKSFSFGNVDSNTNLTSCGDRLLSYSTCIAQHTTNGTIINETKYSVTTSRHVNMVKKYIKSYIAVNNVPIDTLSLLSIIKERNNEESDNS